MATAANAGKKAEANAALARVTKAAANRSALVGVPANLGLGAIVAKAKNNAARAVKVAKQKKNEEDAAAKAAAKAAAEAKAAAAKAAAEANKAAKAKAEANKKAAAKAEANKKAAAAKTAAEEAAARKAQEEAEKKARNAAAAQAKAEANAAKAAQAAKAANIREFVSKLWKLTPGNTNSRTKLWTPRIKNNAELTRQLESLKGTLSEANITAIKNNINRAVANKKIGYWGVWPAEKKNANLNNRIKQAKWIVNMGLGQPPAPQAPWRAAAAQREAAAATKFAATWRGRVTRQKLRNEAERVGREAYAARLAAQPPVGGARAGTLYSLPLLLDQWNKAAPGSNLKAKSQAVANARKGAAPTGLGFRQLHEFFSTHLNQPEANAATMAFYDHTPVIFKIGRKWNGLPAGSTPAGPKNSPGQMPKNDLMNYFKIVGQMKNANAARAANYYYNP